MATVHALSPNEPFAQLDQSEITAWSICDQHLMDVEVEKSLLARSTPPAAGLPAPPSLAGSGKPPALSRPSPGQISSGLTLPPLTFQKHVHLATKHGARLKTYPPLQPAAPTSHYSHAPASHVPITALEHRLKGGEVISHANR